MNTPDSSDKRGATSFPTPRKLGPSSGRWALRGLTAILALVILYALSIGPAVLLNKQGKISPESLEKWYLPLSIVLSAVPGGQQLTERYLRLWVDPGPEHP